MSPGRARTIGTFSVFGDICILMSKENTVVKNSQCIMPRPKKWAEGGTRFQKAKTGRFSRLGRGAPTPNWAEDSQMCGGQKSRRNDK